MADDEAKLLAAAASGDEDAARASLVPVVTAFGPLMDSAGKPVYNTECADTARARARRQRAALAHARLPTGVKWSHADVGRL